MKKISSLLFFLLVVTHVSAQTSARNGYDLPAVDTLRVLMVFAELDCSNCTDTFTDIHGNDSIVKPYFCSIEDNNSWLPGQLPPEADEFLDITLPLGQVPQKRISKYFYEASFGQYIFLGDYYPQTITVPCDQMLGVGLGNVIGIINADTSTFLSAHGYTLDDFDLVSDEAAKGLFKAPASNGTVDLVVIVWRNNQAGFISCATGYGVQSLFSDTLKNKDLLLGTSFGVCSGLAEDAFIFFSGEMQHGLFGENNFHTGSGAGYHTFLNATGSYSITANDGSSSNRVCGWDRWFLGWKGWKNDSLTIPKDSFIACLDTNRNEVYAGLSLPQQPIEQTFILRDFYKTGDAIRIKLPHINWTQLGDVKNQYLWLENHQMLSEFDDNINAGGCKEHFKPGLYAQIQVGKDTLTGPTSIVHPAGSSAEHAKPNALASCLFPVTAEGNFDFHYLKDSVEKNGQACTEGHYVIPIDKQSSQTLANPFTGFNDLFYFYDAGDGKLHVSDTIWTGFGELINNQVVYNGHKRGDSSDAFRLGFNTEINISTNPAPVPVYTYVSGFGGGLNPDYLTQDQEPYENRTIWLNGLAIEILEEIPNSIIGGKDMKLKIRWDNYEIDRDTRWCGNIKLSPHDFDTATQFEWAQPSLNVQSGKTLLIDFGKSYTKQYASHKDDDSNWVFSESTVFTALPGSYFHLDDNAKVIVDNGSSIYFEENSRLEIHDGAEFIVRNNSYIEFDKHAEIVIHPGGKLVIEEGCIMMMRDSMLVKLSGASSVLDIRGILAIVAGSTVKPVGLGYIRFENSISNLQNLRGGNGSKLILEGQDSTETKLVLAGTEGVRTDFNISLIIKKAKIEMYTSVGQPKLDAHGPLTLEHVNMTHNPAYFGKHRGVFIYGQPEVSIKHFHVNNGEWGILARTFYGMNPTNFYQVSASNCDTGIQTQGPGMYMSYCDLSGNYTGWHAVSMMGNYQFLNSIANSIEDGILAEYAQSPSILIVESSTINNNVAGIRAHYSPLIVECTEATNNSLYGIVVDNSVLQMHPTRSRPKCGNNTLSSTLPFSSTIDCNHAWRVWINQGNNNLSGSYKDIIGTMSPTLTTPDLNAGKNHWGVAVNIVLEKNGVPVTIHDVPHSSATIPHTSCLWVLEDWGDDHYYRQPDNENHTLNTPMFAGISLDSAAIIAELGMSPDSTADYTVAIERYHDIITNTYRSLNVTPVNKELLDHAYFKMMYALGQSLYYGQVSQTRGAAVNQYIDMVLEVQDSMDVCLCEINNYDQKKMIHLDRAATLRIAERRDSAMDVLDSMYQWLQSGLDSAVVDKFYCIIEGEDKILDSVITWDEWDSLYTCELDTSSGGGGSGSMIMKEYEYENQERDWEVIDKANAEQYSNTAGKEHIAGDETEEQAQDVESENLDAATAISAQTGNVQPSLLAYPNPADNKVLVKATGLEPGKVTVLIMDAIGRTVIEQELTTTGTIEVNIEVSHLNAGIYNLIVQDKANKMSLNLMIE